MVIILIAHNYVNFVHYDIGHLIDYNNYTHSIDLHVI